MAETTREREQETRILLRSLAKSIKERDIVTYEHSRRVAIYSMRLAYYLHWNRREAYDLAMAALVHDLGKTWIGNDILNRSGPLYDEERRQMERHPIIGARILIGCELHPFYVETVLYHHEAWDGHGYPSGLKGEEIPLSARILAVADGYDMLVSHTYRHLLPDTVVRTRLLQYAGSKFDPQIVRAFITLLDDIPTFVLA